MGTRKLRALGPGECADKVSVLNLSRDEVVKSAMQAAAKRATERIDRSISKLLSRCSDPKAAQRMIDVPIGDELS